MSIAVDLVVQRDSFHKLVCGIDCMIESVVIIILLADVKLAL